MKSKAIYLWTSALLSLFAGGSIIILFILVPFWQSLSPEAVTEWFKNFGSVTGFTMMPMEIVPLLLSAYCWLRAKKLNEEGKNAWLLVNICNLIILAMFFLYFLPVNLLFINKTIDPALIAGELVKWKIIHAGRTLLTLLSALLAVSACLKTDIKK
jgi:hypothetical protein